MQRCDVSTIIKIDPWIKFFLLKKELTCLFFCNYGYRACLLSYFWPKKNWKSNNNPYFYGQSISQALKSMAQSCSNMWRDSCGMCYYGCCWVEFSPMKKRANTLQRARVQTRDLIVIYSVLKNHRRHALSHTIPLESMEFLGLIMYLVYTSRHVAPACIFFCNH